MAAMKFVFLLTCAFAFEQMSNDLKKKIAAELDPFAEMKMISLSPKMQQNRIYENVKVRRGIYPFEVFQSAATEGYCAADENGHFNEIYLERADDFGRTPVFHAACYGHTKIVKFLAEQKVDLESADKWRHTPVLMAAVGGHMEIVRFLADQKCDLEPVDNNGRTPVSVAAENGHINIVKFLAGHKDVRGKTLLHYAAQENCFRDVKILLKYGAEIDARDVDLRSPLFLASIFGSSIAMNVLLEAGANPNLQNREGKTSLHNSAEHTKLDEVAMLLEWKADPNVQDSNGRTAIYCVADPFCQSPLELLDLLLQNNANPNITDSEGKSVLQVILDQCLHVDKSTKTDMYMIEMLLEYEADPNLLDIASYNLALKMATHFDKCPLVKKLVRKRSPSKKIAKSALLRARKKETQLQCDDCIKFLTAVHRERIDCCASVKALVNEEDPSADIMERLILDAKENECNQCIKSLQRLKNNLRYSNIFKNYIAPLYFIVFAVRFIVYLTLEFFPSQ